MAALLRLQEAVRAGQRLDAHEAQRLGVVNEHDVFGDRNGNYVANDALHPSSICPAGSTFGSLDSWSWTSVAIDLMSGPNGKIYESWTY